MRSFRKISAFVALIGLISNIFPVNATFDSQTLMLRDSNNVDYSTALTARTTGGSVEFNLSLIGGTTAKSRVNLSLPSGLTASGYTIESNSCGLINGIGQTNSNFTFDITGTSNTCENIVSVKYVTNHIPANDYSINFTLVDSVDNIFGNGNDIATSSNNVQLKSSNQILILKASSFDSNSDGFINGYNLSFNNPLPASLPSASQIQVTTGSKTATGIVFSGNQGSYTGQLRWSD
jgi:hypothetical protein